MICRIGRTSTPGWRIGHQKNEMPRCFGTSQFVRATSIPYSASLPLDVHTFWPLTTHSSPSRSARVCRPARSEPAPGSEYSRHIFTSSSSSGRTKRSFRDSVPNASTVLAHRLCLSCAAPGAPAWRNSSTTTVGRLAVEAPPEPLRRPRRHGVAGVDDQRQPLLARAAPSASARRARPGPRRGAPTGRAAAGPRRHLYQTAPAGPGGSAPVALRSRR